MLVHTAKNYQKPLAIGLTRLHSSSVLGRQSSIVLEFGRKSATNEDGGGGAVTYRSGNEGLKSSVSSARDDFAQLFACQSAGRVIFDILIRVETGPRAVPGPQPPPVRCRPMHATVAIVAPSPLGEGGGEGNGNVRKSVPKRRIKQVPPIWFGISSLALLWS
jgi:hypothetical protein